MLDPASWFKSFFHGHQHVQWEHDEEPLFLNFVPYDNSLFVVVVVLPACLFNLLLMWSCFSHAREPSWVRNATSISKFWDEMTSGNTVQAVKTGHLCRKYMGHFNPGVLRFTNGPILGGYIRDFLLVKDPVVVKEVLEEKTTRKPERSYRVFRRLHGYRGGYDFLSFRSHTHPVYQRTRNKVYKALMKRTYDHFNDVILPEVDRFVDGLVSSSDSSRSRSCSGKNNDCIELNVVDQMHTFATTMLCRVAFDESSTTFQRSLFESTIWMVNDMLLRPANSAFPWLDKIPTSTNKTLWAHQDTLCRVIMTLIRKKRAQSCRGDDVVSVLLNDPTLSDEDLLGIVAIFFFAGFDTTANTMTMVLYNLARNVDTQRRARDDANAVLSGSRIRSSRRRREEDNASSKTSSQERTTPGSSTSTSSVPDSSPPPLVIKRNVHSDITSSPSQKTATISPRRGRAATDPKEEESKKMKKNESLRSVEQLFQMKYVTACVKETLRMFPVVPMISREVTQSHPSGICPRFDEHKTFGIAINIFGLHYNPNGWAQPDQFLPERWLDPSIDGKKDPSQRVYCPFAIGKRSCLGRHFAYVEMLTLVSSILRKYEIVIVQNHDPVILEAGTLLIDPKLRLGLRPIRDRIYYPTLIPTSENEEEKMYTLDEVSEHHDKDDLWMAINGGVYDLTRFVAGSDGGHPGGAEILLTYAGTNATAEYEFISHSAYALKLLESYRVGRLYESHTPLFKERDWKTGKYRETVRVYSEDWAASAAESSNVTTPSNIRRRKRQTTHKTSFC